MGETTRLKQGYRRYVVHVPYGDVKAFRADMKTLGYKIEKRNALDEAMDDVMAGRVYTYSSVDEMIKSIL